MIARLAAALQIPLREQNLLLRAAGFADAYSDLDIDDEEMGVLRDAVTRMMSAFDPFPSFVIDRHWYVIDTNTSAAGMFTLIDDAFPRGERLNMLDLVFSPLGLRPFVVNWEDYARQMIQRLHREALRPEDAKVSLERLRQFPGIPSDWWLFDVRYSVAPAFVVQMQRGEIALSFFSVVAAIAVPTGSLAQELRIETLFPADGATERHLREMSNSLD